jgi:hypothetical protein
VLDNFQFFEPSLGGFLLACLLAGCAARMQHLEELASCPAGAAVVRVFCQLQGPHEDQLYIQPKYHGALAGVVQGQQHGSCHRS